MDLNKLVSNILKGAEAGSGANAGRAAKNAARRADAMGDVLLDNVGDILMRPDVLASLPADLAGRVKLGDNAAMLEAMMVVMRQGNVPRSIPSDNALTPPPGAEAGFVRGAHGGRVPVSSAGEVIPSGSREVRRNPGAEAGFQMGGDVPPQNFDATGLIPGTGGALIPGQRGGPLSIYDNPPQIDIRQSPRRKERGYNPLLVGAGIAAAGAAGAAGKYLYDQINVAPEEEVPEEEDTGLPDPRSVPRDSEASAALRRAMQKPQEPRFEFGPNDPQAKTYRAMVDAGLEPSRAAAISQNKASMTQMERDALIENSKARRQRERDDIQRRRDSRMGGY